MSEDRELSVEFCYRLGQIQADLLDSETGYLTGTNVTTSPKPPAVAAEQAVTALNFHLGALPLDWANEAQDLPLRISGQVALVHPASRFASDLTIYRVPVKASRERLDLIS